MPKLGYLISQYPAVSHTFVFREVEGLRALGFDIACASINPSQALLESEKEEAKKTFIVKNGSLLAPFRRPLKFITTLIKAFFKLGFRRKTLYYTVEAFILNEWIQKENIFHLHVHFANPAATVGLIHSWIDGTPYSITVHGPDEFYDTSINNLKLKFEEAQFLIAISHYTKSQILKIVRRDVTVIPLGINLDQFPFKEHPIKEPLRILSVGRLHPNKGFETLLNAVKDLNAIVTIVGDGPDREHLEKIKSPNVQLVGAKNHQEVQRLYQENDLFVLASYAEGLPVVLMEAMASGLPVITTTVNAITELVENGKTGLLVAPSNSEQLKEKIQYAISHPEDMGKMAEEARKKVKESFNIDKNIDRLALYLREKICLL